MSRRTTGTPYRGRFAPSPTGDLHFGSLLAALGSWLRARSAGGTWLVRIEDIDPPREVPGSAARILETLKRCGMESDEGVLWQSTRLEVYDSVLAGLAERGLVFECRCSRADLAGIGVHGNACTGGPAAGRRPALRLRVPDRRVCFVDRVRGRRCQHLLREVGAYVVRRVEGYPAYQLAVVVDDASQGITEVVRGADLIDSTPRQVQLQRTLGFPTPAYLHLPLALDESGRKLSKQSRSVPVDARDPLPALRAAWCALGQDPAAIERRRTVPRMLDAACLAFDWTRIPAGSEPAG